MKILQINMEKGWRGGESQTLLSMEQFRQTGHEVELLARSNGELALRAQASGFKVHTKKEVYQAVFFFLLGHAKKYDIIHCQTANSLTWAALFKSFYKSKLVYTRRTAFPVKESREQATKKKWQKADLFVANSLAGMAEAHRLGVVDSVMSMADLKDPSKSKHQANLIIPSATIPEAFDAERFNRMVEEHNLRGKKIIAVIAALTEEKDPLVQIDAIHQLAQQRQDFAVLHFGSGKMLEECQAKIRELGLESTYLVMGFQNQVEQLFEGFDAYLLTSRHEGANNGIINSFFNEVPVVSTASGGPNNLIGEQDERGYLCPVGDSNALANALNLALENSADTEARIKRAKEYALANHTVEVMGKSYLEAYELLLKQS